jgi:hypothetical protein
LYTCQNDSHSRGNPTKERDDTVQTPYQSAISWSSLEQQKENIYNRLQIILNFITYKRVYLYFPQKITRKSQKKHEHIFSQKITEHLVTLTSGTMTTVGGQLTDARVPPSTTRF